MRKRLITFVVSAMILIGSGMTVCAAEKATVTFTQKDRLEYSGVDFYADGTPKLGTAFEGIAPGETAEQVITMRNDNDKTVDFYMNASALQALEDTAQKARGAGYVIKLSAGNKVMYDSNAGGYAAAGTEGSTEGILKMNEGALDGYVLVATLAGNESEDIRLSIFFDGEAMDNSSQSVDYSNTFGQLGFSFQVAYEDPEGPTVIYKEVKQKGETKYVKNLVEILEERVPLASVATGDNALIGFGAVVLVSGIVLVVISGRKKKGDKS